MIGISVLVRFEIPRQRFNERLGQLELRLFHQVPVRLKLWRIPNLVGIVHGVQHDPALRWPEDHDVLAAVHRLAPYNNC
jgi:hypothetical protein